MSDKERDADSQGVGTTVPEGDKPEIPGFLRFAEVVLGTEDAKGVSTVADMALLFYVCGGTILGSLCFGCLFPLIIPLRSASQGSWVFWLLCCVALGGTVGCLLTAALLDARGLLKWERKNRD